MEIEYSLDEADLIALAQYQIQHSSEAKRRFQNRRWVYAISFFLIAIGIYLGFHELFLPLVFVSLAILSYAFFPLYIQQITQNHIKKIVHERMRPTSLMSRKLRALPDGLEQSMENAESKVGWDLVDKVDPSPRYTFISIEGTYSVIIPNDKIDKKTYAEFMAVIRTYCKNAAV